MFRGSGAKFRKKTNLNILTEKLLESTEASGKTTQETKRGRDYARKENDKSYAKRPVTEVKLEPKVVEKDKPLKFINFKSLLTS